MALSLSFSAPSFLNSQKSLAAPFQNVGVEYVRTFADDCSTPKTSFYPGEVVCAQAGDFPSQLDYRYRRLQWAAPDGRVADINNIKIDPHFDKFFIPTSGPYLQYGTWVVGAVNVDADVYAAAKFVVRHPRLPLVNIALQKVGPDAVYAGSKVLYKLWVTNDGPDIAESVALTDDVPEGLGFYALRNASNTAIDCSTPPSREGGQVYCKAPRVAPGETVLLYVYYLVPSDARPGEVYAGKSSVTGATEDLNKYDNFTATEVYVDEYREEGPPPVEEQ